MKRFSLFLTASLFASSLVYAQEVVSPAAVYAEFECHNDMEPFKHLDLSITTGSTGIGFELAMPVAKIAQVRAGGVFMPHFEKTMHFGVEVGELTRKEYQEKYVDKITDGSTPMTYEQWKKETSYSRFTKLNGIMEDFLGYNVDDQIDMVGVPTLNQFKMIVDVFPFRNKNWHVSAGFFLGGNRVAKAYNANYDMPSLMAVSTYNSMYYRAIAEEPMISYGDINLYNPELSKKFKDYGRMTMHVGDFKHDIYASEDVYYNYTEVDPIFGEYVVDANGREIKKGGLRYAKGEKMYSAGDAYRMLPGDDYLVKCNAYANAFRPYIGFGYGGFIDKYKRTQLSFDCGVLFWGGVPDMVTHEGIDLIHDLTNVKSSIQKYLDIAEVFPVFPVLELKISQRLF